MAQGMTANVHVYRFLDFTLALPFDITWLKAIECEPDVVVRLDRTPWERRGQPRPPAGGRNRIVLEFDEAEMTFEDGRQVTVRLRRDQDVRSVVNTYLGRIVGGIAHQRGRLPFHASAIEWNGGVVLILGKSGRGKSTMAQLATITAVAADGNGGFTALFGPAALRLRVPSRDGPMALPISGRWIVPSPGGARDGLPPLAIVVLTVVDTSMPLVAAELSTRNRLHVLLTHTYSDTLVGLCGRRQQQLDLCAGLAARCPGVRLVRPAGADTREESFGAMVRWLKERDIGN